MKRINPPKRTYQGKTLAAKMKTLRQRGEGTKSYVPKIKTKVKNNNILLKGGYKRG